MFTLQKFMHSVLFDHHLERDDEMSQCRVIQECFDAHAQRCSSQFTLAQMAFMRIMCLSSCLHGFESTISSVRTRGIMQLLFFRLCSLTDLEKEVLFHTSKIISCHNLQTRLCIYTRVAMNTSIAELAAWTGLIIYAHTVLSDNAVTGFWNGVYDERLRYSVAPSWDVSRGQDPRFTTDTVQLMTDVLLASLGICCLYPVSVSASLTLLLPMTVIIQVRRPIFTVPCLRGV